MLPWEKAGGLEPEKPGKGSGKRTGMMDQEPEPKKRSRAHTQGTVNKVRIYCTLKFCFELKREGLSPGLKKQDCIPGVSSVLPWEKVGGLEPERTVCRNRKGQCDRIGKDGVPEPERTENPTKQLSHAHTRKVR